MSRFLSLHETFILEPLAGVGSKDEAHSVHEVAGKLAASLSHATSHPFLENGETSSSTTMTSAQRDWLQDYFASAV